MAIQSQPSRIPEPFAGSGTKNTIPATNATPSASQAASWASGFPPECSQPISAGGCPVPRNDVNGALNQLSQDFAFRQDGGVWEWSALADYDAARVVRGSDGVLYWSVQPSGPGIAAGAQDPTTDAAHAYWISPKVATMPDDDISNCVVNTQWINNWWTSQATKTDIYIDGVNGDDSNDGSQASPYKSISKAINSLENSAFKPLSCNIHIAGGAPATNIFGVSGVDVTFIGEGSGANINAIYIIGGKYVNFKGHFLLTANPSNYSYAMTITRNSVVSFQDGTIFEFSGSNNSKSLVWVSNNSFAGFQNGASATFKYNSVTTYVNFYVYSGSTLSFAGANITWQGSVTGRKYMVNVLSSLLASGGANNIPGSVAGSVDSSSVLS